MRFGPFVIDEARRKLLRDGEPVALTGKAFDVLLALVERRDRVVTRAELLEQVWAGVVVEEANLTQAISVVRKALGDGFITTVPGRGYRFVAPIDAPVTAAPRDTRRYALIAAVAALVIAAWLLGRATATTHAGTSIAVLPFYDRDAAATQLGMDVTELAIAQLSRDSSLKVSSSRDVLEFRDPRDDTPAAAGRQLRVDRVVSGSLTMRGANVRVAVELVRSKDGATLASSVFEEPLGDPSTLARRIAARVVAGVTAAR
ncbi:MAG TPA: winged helix-turn-helix domain-containing protein [Thermoanaerobaculia bacterium]|nr:winged helix-turn-helix domain-containing protein [Thermoanaerobaculia bacterium]